MDKFDLVIQTANNLPREQRIVFLKTVLKRMEEELAERGGDSYADAVRIKKEIFRIRSFLDNIELNPTDNPDKEIELLMIRMSPGNRLPFLRTMRHHIQSTTEFTGAFREARIQKIDSLIRELETPVAAATRREDVN